MSKSEVVFGLLYAAFGLLGLHLIGAEDAQDYFGGLCLCLAGMFVTFASQENNDVR